MANSDKERLEKSERERRDEIERLRLELQSIYLFINKYKLKISTIYYQTKLFIIHDYLLNKIFIEIDYLLNKIIYNP
jgi:hypothetical protein